MTEATRARLLAAIQAETEALNEYYAAKDSRQELSEQYFSEAYGVSKGEVVYIDDGRRQVRLDAYIQWSDDPAARPDISGYLKMPFGWSRKTKEFTSDEWLTESEMEDVERDDVNGNL